MPTIVNADLRRLILQSEADLLAHARLRLRASEADENLAADARQGVVAEPGASPMTPSTGRGGPATPRQEP